MGTLGGTYGQTCNKPAVWNISYADMMGKYTEIYKYYRILSINT